MGGIRGTSVSGGSPISLGMSSWMPVSPPIESRPLPPRHPFQLLYDFYRLSGYEQRRHEPGVLDFTFGDPHDPPSEAYVEILREALIPQHELWFAYNFGDAKAIEAATESLRRHVDLPFEPDDVHLTTGGFAAISIALKIVGDVGDEVVYSLPPWFLYEPLVLEAGLVPVKVSIDRETLDLDLDAIAAAITPRTRIVIVNSPNNPTGRIYPPATLERLATILDEASERNGRRIFLISDEPYNRIVYDGARFRSPLEFYPWSFLAYSYGKTLLSPGERIGYLAVAPDHARPRAVPRRDRGHADQRRLALPQRLDAVRAAAASSSSHSTSSCSSASATPWSRRCARSDTASPCPRARSTCSPSRRSPTTSRSRRRSTARACSSCPGACSRRPGSSASR